MRRKTILLKRTAVESLTLAVELFNRPVALGRDHSVVMLAAHAFEMILKAIIYQERGSIRAPGSEYTHSLEKCVNVARTDLGVLTPDDVPVLLALKQDRDAAAHDTISMSDDLLWVHVRSAVTIFGRLLEDHFSEHIEDVVPAKVVPMSAHPPTDIGVVLGGEMEALRRLLAPRVRKSAEARNRLRPLLALDGASSGREEPPTELEVTRAQRALRNGAEWRTVFPGLAKLELARADEEGTHSVVLRFGRDPAGLPVRPATEDDEGALAYRTLNVFDKYSITLSSFGERLGLTRHEGYAVIHALGLRDDPDLYYLRTTKRGNVQWQGLSRAALERARHALSEGLDVQDAVKEYNASRRRAKRKRRTPRPA